MIIIFYNRDTTIIIIFPEICRVITIMLIYNNRQLNPGQYKNFNSGWFQNRREQYENRFLQNNNTQQNSNYTEIICNYCKKTQ